MRIKSNKDFVHLHNHSEYSSFDGLNKMSEWVLHARKMGFRSLALTDHGNVGGLIKFAQECRRKKDKNDNPIVDANGKPIPELKPIFGEEFYLARDHTAKNPDGRKGNRHLLILAKNAEGFKNLCKLSQRSWTNGTYIDPRIDLNMLAQHSKGLICSSACLGSVINYNLLKGRYDVAKRTATLLKDIFNDDFYLEVMYHGIGVEGAVVPEILKLGYELGIPVIATNDCHYCRKDQARSQEVLMAMSTSKCLKDPKRIHFPHDEFYLKSAEEMSIMFGSHPEVLYNTVGVAEKIEDFLRPKPGEMRLPVFNVDKAREKLGEHFAKECENGEIGKSIHKLKSDNETFEKSYALMVDLCTVGMKRLGWENSADHLAALKKELIDIRVAWESNHMDFATYFLIVWDYINFARERGIMTGCGRGSGYASIILRAMRITYGPDPLKYGLLWERFLGFDDKYFVLDSDWGFDEQDDAELVEVGVMDDDLDDERLVEDDTGGVDRY